MSNGLLVFLAGSGASLGAMARYAVMQLAQIPVKQSRFPWATFGINLAGSFLLGILMTGPMPLAVKVIVGAGVLGGFTTFSTMINEVLLLERQHQRVIACCYLLMTLLGGVTLAWLGTIIA
ncbi:fluoride efflux transporter FluC [Furfurilactobacillus curtus]|uniref:Fluoride-specific ion channel FluC n=1 Tax=Furfurilactobacillus curtus TaxID=1746200 RepID=A0ABQ5JMD2_9LACO